MSKKQRTDPKQPAFTAYVQPLLDSDPTHFGRFQRRQMPSGVDRAHRYVGGKRVQDWKWNIEAVKFDRATTPLRLPVPAIDVNVSQTGGSARNVRLSNHRSRGKLRWAHLQPSILSRTFEFVIPRIEGCDEKRGGYAEHDSVAVFQLLAVNKTWRSILQSSPRLWMHTNFTCFQSMVGLLHSARLLRCWKPEETKFGAIDLRRLCEPPNEQELRTNYYQSTDPIHECNIVPLRRFVMTRMLPGTESIRISHGHATLGMLWWLLSLKGPGTLETCGLPHLHLSCSDQSINAVNDYGGLPIVVGMITQNEIMIEHMKERFLPWDPSFFVFKSDFPVAAALKFVRDIVPRLSVTARVWHTGTLDHKSAMQLQGMLEDIRENRKQMQSLKDYQMSLTAWKKATSGFRVESDIELFEWKDCLHKELSTGFPFTKEEVGDIKREKFGLLQYLAYNHTIHFSRTAFE